MLRQLAIEKEDYLLASEVDRYPAGTKVQRGQALFPRMDVEEEMGKIYAKNNALMAQRQGISLEELLARQNAAKQAPHEEKEKEEAKEEAVDYMTFDDFEKVEMKVGQVVKCEVHPDADKLLIETVDFGDETRTVVSGIREWMSPEEMEGKKFVFVTNLPPRKIRGIESQAMILTAEAEEAGVVCPLTPVKDVPNGSLIG